MPFCLLKLPFAAPVQMFAVKKALIVDGINKLPSSPNYWSAIWLVVAKQSRVPLPLSIHTTHYRHCSTNNTAANFAIWQMILWHYSMHIVNLSSNVTEYSYEIQIRHFYYIQKLFLVFLVLILEFRIDYKELNALGINTKRNQIYILGHFLIISYIPKWSRSNYYSFIFHSTWNTSYQISW